MLLKHHIHILLALLVLGGLIVPVSAYWGNSEGVWQGCLHGATCEPAQAEPNITLQTHLEYHTYASAPWQMSCNGNMSEAYNVSNFCTIGDIVDSWYRVISCTSLPPDCEVGDTLIARYNGFNYDDTEGTRLLKWNITGDGIIAPTASFTCTPTSQFPDENVVCTDTSTGPPSDWLWSIDMETAGIDGWMTSTSQNFTWASHYPGIYSVNLRVNNTQGTDWENKSSYVSISENATPNSCYLPVATGYSRTLFQCTDASTDAAISGCNLQLHDLEGSAWSNTTDRADGTWCIDTLPNHHLNAYGDATGYSDGTRFNVLEWNGITYTILMIPGYVPAAATGKVWVYVYVTDMDTGLDLAEASVSISGTGETTKSDYTDSSGAVRLQWANASTAYINVAKAGYTTGIKVITTSDFGPDMVYVTLHRGTQTATITPTPGPGGVTTAPTAAPHTNPDGSYSDNYTNLMGQDMLDYLATNGMTLVQLCFMVTCLALLGFKFGK